MTDERYPLTYKTRGNSTPQGKQKVYFCCHPGEFARFFERISDEILAEQNCAIWYPKDVESERDASFLEELEGMRLFVMPVTRELLTTKNPAIDLEFPYAIEHRISVLPLMQESGLEALFNERCGNLQFLDPFHRDPTAIPYEEKFKKHLAAVLVGDELAEQVREAFDAYVFLSYRKKDRKHARELMHLIHDHAFCRDIAIWYDEFLTPGTDFNEAIRAAMEKSGMFVFAVTPNLVSEKNYVMTVEYPKAKEAAERDHKPILPAEMVATDREALAAHYPAIPTPTDAHNDGELTEALLRAVERMAKKENDGSHRHNFFIGLAYLSGIDVEVDHARALSLITSAADGGLIEAIDKLVDMYEKGDGVERNFLTAIDWRERKIELLRQRYLKAANEETLYEAVQAIIECAAAYDEINDLNRANEQYYLACHVMTDFYRKFAERVRQEPPTKYGAMVFHRQMICFARMSANCLALGDTESAIRFGTYALEICQRLEKDNGTDYWRDQLAVSYRVLGEACRVAGDFEQAADYLDRACEISERLAETHTEEADYRETLATSLSCRGEVLREAGKLAEAKACCQKACELLEQLVKEGREGADRYLAYTYNGLAMVCMNMDERTEATAYFEKTVAIWEEMAATVGTGQVLQDMAHGYINLSVVADRTKSKSYCERAIALQRELLAQSDTVPHRHSLAHSYLNLGMEYRQDGDTDTARENYRSGVDLLEEIAEKSHTRDTDLLLAMLYVKCADVTDGERRSYLQRAGKILERLTAQYPEVSRYHKLADHVRAKLLLSDAEDEGMPFPFRLDLFDEDLDDEDLSDEDILALFGGGMRGEGDFDQYDLSTLTEYDGGLSDEEYRPEEEAAAPEEKATDTEEADESDARRAADPEALLRVIDKLEAKYRAQSNPALGFSLALGYARLSGMQEAADPAAARSALSRGIALLAEQTQDRIAPQTYELLAELQLRYAALSEGEERLYAIEKALELTLALCEQFPRDPRYRGEAEAIRERLKKERDTFRAEQARRRKREQSLPSRLSRLFRKKKK